jgi:MFS family permease
MTSPLVALERLAAGPPLPDDASDEAKLRRNMRINTAHGISMIVAFNMVQPFLSIFAMKLEANALQVALLSSGPAIVSLFAMIPGAALVDRQDKKKRMTTLFLFAHRAFYLLLAMVPLFAPGWRAWALVGLVALMNLPGAIFNTAWQSFISRIIPPDRRATAFADRNKFMNLAGTIVVLIVGTLLDRMKFPYGYQIVFGIAFLLALFEARVFGLIDEDAGAAAPPSIPLKRPDTAGRRSGLSHAVTQRLDEAMSHPRFIRYTLAGMLFYLAWQVPWPLFSLYQVKVLGANNTWVSILSLMNTGGSLVGYGYWVKVMQRHGNLKTLFYSTVWIFIVPAVYAFSKSLITIAIFNMLTGAIFSGVNLALFNALLEATPETNKTSYIAYFNTATTVSAVIAPLIGVRLLGWFGYQLAFIICAVLRILGSLAFLGISRDEHHPDPAEAAPANA